jgi:hypothetical protein
LNNLEWVTIVDVSLTQDAADTLIALPKIPSDDSINYFPAQGERLNIALISKDKRYQFLLDIGRERMGTMRVTYQNRYNKAIILVRVDFKGKPHRNPDGQEIPCTHIHTYREDFGDKWAYPLSEDTFTNQDDYWQVLMDFCKFCAIELPQPIQRGLT